METVSTIDKYEVWKPIKGYVGRYEVSNFGNVKSCAWTIITITGKIINYKEKVFVGSFSVKGYLTATFRLNGGHKQEKIHRLVAEAFIPNPEKKPQINHKNGIKTDNRVDNLEWATNGENQLHSYRTLNKKAYLEGKFSGNHPQSKKVAQYEKDGVILIKIWDSTSEAARSVNIDPHCIFKSIHLTPRKNNAPRLSAGFVWKRI